MEASIEEVVGFVMEVVEVHMDAVAASSFQGLQKVEACVEALVGTSTEASDIHAVFKFYGH